MKKVLKILKKLIKPISITAFIILMGIIISHQVIVHSAKNKTYDDVALIPKNKVGLVLGTSKMTKNGWQNLYFTYRVDAAVELYHNGKIDFILISGDNGSKEYDEPSDFKVELIKKGIPENRIILDYAGFRTLDSVNRAKEIFGQKRITIISQKFHNERAIFLAQHFGIEAIGYNAKDVSKKYGFWIKIREYLARTKAIIDVTFDVQPKFLGKKIKIG